MRYSAKWPQYRVWWDRMVIRPARLPEFVEEAHFAIAHKATYQAVAARANEVKWYHIALLHRREADGNFNDYLGNGQPLSQRTTEVPAGRGPFRGPTAFADGAIDALRIDGYLSVHDWRLEKILYYCEIFNGTGYNNRDLPSPYVWGGTNIQRPGKYVGDHKFSASKMDPQPGCAPLLWTIAKLDPTVIFVRET